MPIEKRVNGTPGSAGPFLAEVTNYLDPTYMGGLEVALIKGISANIGDKSQIYPVRYLSPFYGATSIRYEGTNSGDFNDVQKSYGMWMVPPDIGAIVMVIFIDGDANQGYWIGCAQNQYQNHMVPGIAASNNTKITKEQERKYGTSYLPVAEFHKSSQILSDSLINNKAKPVHPFADRLLAQGLLLDTVRGVTSSSARREIPSSVFGISTPGPLDKSPGAKRGTVGYEGNTQTPVSRLGGSTFVMDDGDESGQNELVRIRTRTGHQILLHNTQDLIYIANSKGTAWIEMTSNGKIDIYAHDSISVHSENDFNFRADRDINIEAGRNLNIRAIQHMETNVTGHYFLTVDDTSKISIKNDYNLIVGKTNKTTIGTDYNLGVSKNLIQTAGVNVEIGAESQIKLGSAGILSLGSNGNVLVSGAQIHLNGPAAPAPQSAIAAESPPLLPVYSLPNTNVDVGWSDKKFYKEGVPNLSSIMQRVPTHEPWSQHENTNPPKYVSASTDAGLQSRSASGVADNPAVGKVPSTNTPEVVAGTCDIKYAKDINSSSSQAGISALKTAATEFGITSPYAIAAILGIAGGENTWKTGEENLTYKTTARLLQIFPSAFKGNTALAAQYVNKPDELAEFVYGYQTSKGKELGNSAPGDGVKFKGRGYIQLTGRANYAKYSTILKSKGKLPSADSLITSPTLLIDSVISAYATVAYFIDRVKLPQTDPGYFEEACRKVGYNTPDIKAKKTGFYQCFLSQLQGGVVSTGTGGILVDSQGNPIRTGIVSQNTR